MYRIEDIDKVKQNINNITEKAQIVFKNIQEPTIKEYNEIINYILEYIKNNKNIIYGGYAQNKLISVKNINDVFYKNFDTPDIEFYSYEPIKDTVKLSDFLYNKKCKFVRTQQGLHEGTYKIFVNFENYCDISYLPKNIFNKLHYIEIDNIRYTHPYYMYIDFYRIFTDPSSFDFRLEKSFNRYTRLYKYYPITNNNIIFNIIPTNNNILSVIRKKILHNSQYIIIGKYCYNYYASKAKQKKIPIDFYEIITITFKNDIVIIDNILKKKFDKITKKNFCPFGEAFGERTEYYLDNKLILRVYDNYDRCIVNTYSEKKKCFFGTNQLLLLYLLGNYNYSYINKNIKDTNNYLLMIYNIIIYKNNYLELHNKTVLDKTPFEDFLIKCNGNALDIKREYHLKIIKHKKNNKKLIFSYEPTGKEMNIPVFQFDNKSGNEILKK
jgi:hypothetical protein